MFDELVSDGNGFGMFEKLKRVLEICSHPLSCGETHQCVTAFDIITCLVERIAEDSNRRFDLIKLMQELTL